MLYICFIFYLQILFYLKLYLFREQLELSNELKQKLRSITVFICLFYTPAWLACPVAADAPSNDLALHQNLLRYKTIDKEVATTALAVLNRHVWYLRPQTVVLALTSTKVSPDVKEAMATKLVALDPPDDYADDNIVVTEDTELVDLVNERSWFIFRELQICGYEFLSAPVAEWEEDSQYRNMAKFMAELKVTNDIAEQAVQMIGDLANSVTKDEDQLRDLLQLVEHHRRVLPSFDKASLMTL